MNMTAKLKALLSDISEQLRFQEMNIGDSEPGYNDFSYDHDGWNISFEYYLTGKWVRGEGFDCISAEVLNLSVEYCDEETDESPVFRDDQIIMFREDLEAIINNIF